MPTLHLTGPLGTSLSVETTDDTLLSTLRKYGKTGWSSGEIPAGGLVLPHGMADTFDWALIGARPYTNSDGEQAVMHRGHSYKRRDFEAKTTGVKMPACIKYSRGAKPTDPPHLKEGDESGVQYVTLIMFKGTGKALSQYEVPSTNKPTEQRQQPAQTAPLAPAAPDPAQKARTQYFAIVKGTLFEQDAGRAELIEAATRHATGGQFVTKSLTEALALNDPTITRCILDTAQLWADEERGKAGAA